MQVCQNGVLATSPTIDIDINTVVNRYTNNPITSAIIIAGLEPFDTFNQLINLIDEIREYTDDDIVIYTGYYKNEIEDKIDRIKIRKNIIIKFGRYIPNQQPHYDEVLGIYLASDNQYAERIS